MPLTPFQAMIAQLLASQRTPDSHLAGGAAIHVAPNSKRYSNDLDFFHDSEARVAQAFAEDRRVLSEQAYEVDVQITQPGYIRAVIRKGAEATRTGVH